MLDKLFDIFKKSGESKIIVIDRQTGEFYVLSKWEEYEKTLANKVPVNPSTPQSPVKIAVNNAEENMSGISDEERFFMEG